MVNKNITTRFMGGYISFFIKLIIKYLLSNIYTYYKKTNLRRYGTVGATKQNRTADLRVTNPLLYQLSYSGKYI